MILITMIIILITMIIILITMIIILITILITMITREKATAAPFSKTVPTTSVDTQRWTKIEFYSKCL